MDPERLEKTTSAIKNIAQLLVFFCASLALILLATSKNFRTEVSNITDDLHITAVKVGPFEIARALANNPPPQTAAATAPVKDATPPSVVANVLGNSTDTNSFWVYLGEVENNQFVPPQNFEISQPPQQGSIITASTDTYMRSTAPQWDKEKNEWEYGKIIAVLRRGQQIKVTEIKSIQDEEHHPRFYWACAWRP
jgi:hypothetical protein